MSLGTEPTNRRRFAFWPRTSLLLSAFVLASGVLALAHAQTPEPVPSAAGAPVTVAPVQDAAPAPAPSTPDAKPVVVAPAPTPPPPKLPTPAPVAKPAFAAPVAPAPVAAPVAPPPTAAAPEAANVKPGTDVKVHDSVVFRVLIGRGKKTAEDRARAAAQALDHALEADEAPVSVEAQGEARVVFAGGTPVIELYADDATAAGDASLEVHSARISARVKEVLQAEKQRSVIASFVFSISLVVFFGLVALYVLRRIGELAHRARETLQQHPERIPAIRFRSIEVIGANPLRALLSASLIVGRWILQVGVVYVWLVVTFSRFDATRPLTERLTSFVIAPLSQLAGRLFTALPLGLLAVVSVFVVYVMVRFVELFFASSQRADTRIAWVPSDLLAPASVLVRAAIVILALVFAGPVVTGEPEGTLTRAGSIVMLALGFAATPLLATLVIGIVQVFARRVRVGQELTLAGARGRVLAVGLLDIRLRADDGSEVRVPHLRAILEPQRTRSGELKSAVVYVSVAPSHGAEEARNLLLVAANGFGEAALVELVHFDADGWHFRVSVATRQLPERPEHAQSELRMCLAQAMQSAGMTLGRGGPAGSGAGPGAPP